MAAKKAKKSAKLKSKKMGSVKSLVVRRNPILYD